MSSKLRKRFWSAMSERYGRRWTDQYGAEASASWAELIDAYDPEDVRRAIDGLANVSPEFPPTFPQFENLLARAAAVRKSNSTNFRRGYWRSLIVHEVSQDLGYTFRDFETVLVTHRSTLGTAMLELLNESEQTEAGAGERTWEQERNCATRSRRIAKNFVSLARALHSSV